MPLSRSHTKSTIANNCDCGSQHNIFYILLIIVIPLVHLFVSVHPAFYDWNVEHIYPSFNREEREKQKQMMLAQEKLAASQGHGAAGMDGM